MPLPSVFFRSALLLWAGAALFACGSGAVPPPEEPEPEPVAEPEPEPAPKPECKSLDEKCAATADTQAAIAKTDLVFIPPAGWLYAQEPEVTITQTAEGGGGLSVTAIEAKDPKSRETRTRRDEAIEKLASALGLTLPEKNRKRVSPNWDRPDGDVKVGEMTLEMWQFEGAGRGSKMGPVLFFSTRRGDTLLLGMGFAPKGDSSDAEIMKALETIGPAPVEGESTQ
jgi:hypothetical protein